MELKIYIIDGNLRMAPVGDDRLQLIKAYMRCEIYIIIKFGRDITDNLCYTKRGREREREKEKERRVGYVATSFDMENIFPRSCVHN
jgi:hypothetical protein